MTVSPRSHPVFNQPDRFVEGWYWAVRSREVPKGQVKAVRLLGRDLAIYRRWDGTVQAVDAYCPHMGAHLAEGHVESDGLRCFFHNWKFDATGECIDIPSLGHPLPVCIQTWPTEEQYGLIWVWTGKVPQHPIPFVPELEGIACESIVAKCFVKRCHPNVVMINAIDAHHFNTVHQLPLEIQFQKRVLSQHAIAFTNATRGGDESWFIRLIRPLYKEAVTYKMCYWSGSTGTVTVGPDFLHFHIMFALRSREDGQTEGQTVLITEKRSGIWGWLYSRILLWLTQQVGNYFAKGDTQIFQTIQFDLKTPIRADQSILEFIHHVDQQSALMIGSWQSIDTHSHLNASPSPIIRTRHGHSSQHRRPRLTARPRRQ